MTLLWIAQGLVLFLIGVTFVVICFYLYRWHVTGRHWLLPHHIWLVALSYDGFLLVAAWRLHRQATPGWVLWLVVASSLVGLYSMLEVARLQVMKLRMD